MIAQAHCYAVLEQIIHAAFAVGGDPCAVITLGLTVPGGAPCPDLHTERTQELNIFRGDMLICVEAESIDLCAVLDQILPVGGGVELGVGSFHEAWSQLPRRWGG